MNQELLNYIGEPDPKYIPGRNNHLTEMTQANFGYNDAVTSHSKYFGNAEYMGDKLEKNMLNNAENEMNQEYLKNYTYYLISNLERNKTGFYLEGLKQWHNTLINVPHRSLELNYLIVSLEYKIDELSAFLSRGGGKKNYSRRKTR